MSENKNNIPVANNDVLDNNNNIDSNNKNTVNMENNNSNNNPMIEVISTLTKAYEHFNKTLLDGAIPGTPVITILSQGQKKALGWFSSERWSGGENNNLHEICICAETLRRSNNEVFETLIHEMAHLYNNTVAKVKDCNKQQYHNKNFKTAAEKLGLKVEKSKMRGFSITSLDERATAAIEAFNYQGTFNVFRQRSMAAVNLKKMYMINVSEETKLAVMKYATENGMSQKEAADYLISAMINREMIEKLRTVVPVDVVATKVDATVNA